MRYRAPPPVFDLLATEGMFLKSYRAPEKGSRERLLFDKPPVAFWTAGLEPLAWRSPSPPRRARFLVTPYWPWVTSVRIKARPQLGPATLEITSRGFFQRRPVGRATFQSAETIELTVPPGTFDSGINEIERTSDAPVVLESWEWVDDSVHDHGVRVFGGR